MIKIFGAGVLGLAVAGAASAADPSATAVSPLVAKLAECRSIGDDAQRLACFDRESAALVSAVSSGNVAVVDQGQLRAARRSLFGFQLPKLPFFSGDKSADDVPNQIDTTIRTAEDIGRGRYRVTLADGAVWETTDSPMRLTAPRAGNKIVIKKASLGSYFLRIDGQVGVKGRRIK